MTPYPDLDDKQLLAAHVKGDRVAFSELVHRHQNRLYAVALRTLRDPDDAADALQDALISAFRSAGTYRGEAAVTTWLHRVVVNACLDRIRRAKSRPTDPLPTTDVASGRDEHSALEARLDVTAALARLPEHQRLAVVLVDLQDLSVSEAAAVLDVAEGTIKSRCSRGRAALAEILRPANTEDGKREDGNQSEPLTVGDNDPSERTGDASRSVGGSSTAGTQGGGQS